MDAMKNTLWGYLKIIREEFSETAVVGLAVHVLNGESTCMVTVKNADGNCITWEHVDDGVSASMWVRVENSPRPLTVDVDEPIPYITSSLVYEEGDSFDSCDVRGLKED